MKFYIGTQSEPEDRLLLEISEEDMAKCRPKKCGGPWKATVTDIKTGRQYDVEDADCGLGCRCAAQLQEF